MTTQPAQAPAYSPLSPAAVAATFVRQYYSVRHSNPASLFRFYSKDSVVQWPTLSDFATSSLSPRPPGAPAPPLEQCSGPAAIDAKVATLGLEALVTDVRSVDSAPTGDGGLVVLVTGVLTHAPHAHAKDGDAVVATSSPRGHVTSARAFAQTFFLQPQAPSGFFVALDLMRLTSAPPPPAAGGAVVGAPAPGATASPRQHGGGSTEQSQSQQHSAVVPIPIPFAELSLADAAAAAASAAAQASASQPAAPGTPPQLPVRMGGAYSQQQQQQQQQQQWGGQHSSYDQAAYAAAVQAEQMRAMAAAYGPYAYYPGAGGAHLHPGQAGPHMGNHMAMGLPPLRHDSRGGQRSSRASLNAAPQCDDTASIFVRRLPAEVTPAELEAEFSRFGPLKGGVGGVTLKSSNNRHFAFLEFESRDAALAAQAQQVQLAGRNVEVEQKRPMSSSRARGRGRGRVGFGGAASYDGAFAGGFEAGAGGEAEGGSAMEGGASEQERGGSPAPPPPPAAEELDSAEWPRPSAASAAASSSSSAAAAAAE